MSDAVEAILALPARRIDKSRVEHAVGFPSEASGSLAVKSQMRPEPSNNENLRNSIERITIGGTAIVIQLSDAFANADGQDRVLTVPWTMPSPHRRREIIQGEGEASSSPRPMRVRARAVFLEALRDAHRWLDELTRDSDRTIESLAAREGKTERSIRMTLSLAFVAPPIVKAAIEGRLPRGFGVKRLIDLPMAWPQQWRALGLKAPTPT